MLLHAQRKHVIHSVRTLHTPDESLPDLDPARHIASRTSYSVIYPLSGTPHLPLSGSRSVHHQPATGYPLTAKAGRMVFGYHLLQHRRAMDPLHLRCG